jgi:hypothetical protein
MSETVYRVEVQPDFIQRLSKVQHVTGLAELIWNSLDADASHVEVVLDSTFTVERVIVRDDGTALPYAEAPALFKQLGNSWKRTNGLSRTKRRFLHGSEGQGRFKALALGRIVSWHVVHMAGDRRFEVFDVWVKGEAPSDVHVSDVQIVESAKPGVTVTITELAKNFEVLNHLSTSQSLTEIFSSYLRSYPDVKVTLPTGVLDPAAAIESTKEIELPDVEYEEVDYPATLELVAWKFPTDRFLYFCDERGLSQGRSQLRVHAPGFNVSAHLKSSLVPKLAQDGILGLEEMHPALIETLDRVGEEVKTFHRERLSKDAESLVDTWKREDVYPYQGEPANQVERIERQVFDIVASRVNTHIPDFSAATKKSKQFQLRLLRQAVEKSPEDLRRILTQVLDLPQVQRRELAELLDYVSLSGIISAAKLVADRLQFLAGLERVLYATDERKVLKERKQLHRMLVGQTWIFGEEFALSVDDQSLNEVLKRHLEVGKLSDVDLATPVLRPSGKRGIIDLMLSRRIPRGREDEREHLVVELKRPRKKVGATELNQLKEYALAVAKDDRFRQVNAIWNFWLLTLEYDPLVEAEANQNGRPVGLTLDHQDLQLRVWVKTWAQVLEENRARLRFVQERLDWEPDQEAALQLLKSKFSDLFSQIDEAEAVEQAPNETESPQPEESA